MNDTRAVKFLLALIFACGLLVAPVRAQRQMSPPAQDEGQNGGRRQGRLATPSGLKCDVNQTTSFTGRVLAYSRRSGRISIRVRTDEETTEAFTIPYAKGEDISKWFTLDGQAIKRDDLAKIESRWKRNKRPARVTVWACYDKGWRKLSAERIDWRSGVR